MSGSAIVSTFVDLNEDPDKLLGGMNSTTRNEVRRGYKDPIVVEFDANPALATAEEFHAFYDRFAQAKKLAPANWMRLGSMQASGRLLLSRVKDTEGNALVWHCYLRDRSRARLLHSASVYRLNHSKEREKLVSRANRHLHWRDMLALRELGVATYDFGGWYAGREDKAMLRINSFKEGFGGRVVDLHNTYHGVTMKGRLAVRLHRWRGGE